MKLVRADGTLAKARRFVSAGGNVSQNDVTDPAKLAELVRGMSARISELEARSAPQATEFQVFAPSGGQLIRLQHNISGPVRYFATFWLHANNGQSPASGPALVRDDTSTSDVLVLRSYVAGHVVIRVEQAQSEVDPGIYVGDSVGGMSAGILSKAMNNTNQTLSGAEMAAQTVIATGAITAARSLIWPFQPVDDNTSRLVFVRNGTTGGFNLNVQSNSGTTTAIGSGGSSAVLFATTGTTVFPL